LHGGEPDGSQFGGAAEITVIAQVATNGVFHLVIAAPIRPSLSKTSQERQHHGSPRVGGSR
jgi:hypothetical protein